jgi:Tol biopolymer transport system component
MTERWQAQLERLERLNPDEGLLERARQRPATPLRGAGAGNRVGAVVVAVLLTAGLALGGYAVLRERGGSPVPPPAAPTGAPQNGDLLFAAHLEDAWHVYAVDPQTGEERELTGGTRDYASDWSPDATRIVYDTDDGDVVVAEADGSNPVAIARGSTPAWAPDGSRIAYTGEDGRIWVVGVDGSDAHAVTDPPPAREESQQPPWDWNASWSPDGRSIAYTRFVADRLLPMPNGKGRTYVMLEELRVWSEDGTDVALTDAYTGLGDLDWSPDGSVIVFTGAPTLYHEEATTGEFWPRVLLISSAGGEVTAITPERERWIGGATWSPDGEWIAFQDDYETIAIVRPDGSERTEIDLGYEVIGLSWGVAPPAG